MRKGDYLQPDDWNLLEDALRRQAALTRVALWMAGTALTLALSATAGAVLALLTLTRGG